MVSVPCKVGISIVRDIYDVNSHLVGKDDWIVSCADGSAKQCKTSKTLSVKPLSDLQLLRNDNAHEQVVSVSVKDSSQMLNSTGASFELIAEVPGFFERGTKVGFEVCRSSVGDEVTTILYDDAEKRVIIDCSKSSTAMCAVFADDDVKPISEPIWGYFYLLRASLHSRTCRCERNLSTLGVLSRLGCCSSRSACSDLAEEINIIKHNSKVKKYFDGSCEDGYPSA
ncbi:hypothetical protein PF001_g2844 [Phytophthora fragariae]|uniref:Glycosyl hydrolase family 32 C-terminal domain-containing protein n=1 Tax=Phytophthora fragariae TaxID=53985 RepID=A0A6A4ENC5_9STRA|nr:hypothetical protein PF001_g2844 [Phytophthora fragariae]